MSATVSVCIPVFNMVSSIRGCILSALRQDYDNFEVVVIDNGSTDGTWEIAQALADPRLRVIRNQTNLGAYGNHNRCLEVASGDWIKFLHGDDELLPHCLKEMTKAISDGPAGLGLVSCGAIQLGPDDQVASLTPVPTSTTYLRAAPVGEFIEYGNFVGTPSMVMVHRQAMIALGGFDSAMEPAADGEAWIRMRGSYASGYLSSHLVEIRDDPRPRLAVRVRQSIGFCRGTLGSIVKHAGLSTGITGVVLDSRFAKAICLEMFRYWDRALYYAALFRFDLLLFLCRSLRRERVLGRALVFYVTNRLRGRAGLRLHEQQWTEGLMKLVITPRSEATKPTPADARR